MNDKIGTLHLTVEDSKNLIRELYFPTQEEINERKKIREKLYRDIRLEKTDNGFEAEIKDLDLSFLEESKI